MNTFVTAIKGYNHRTGDRSTNPELAFLQWTRELGQNDEYLSGNRPLHRKASRKCFRSWHELLLLRNVHRGIIYGV